MKITDKFISIKIEQATNSPMNDGYYNIMTNRFWLEKDGEIFFYKDISRPQCNKDRAILESFAEKYKFNIVHIPIVYLEHRCGDYI